MPRPPSPRDIATIDRELAVADAERIRLTQVAQAFRHQSDSGPQGPAKLAALQRAWEAQRVVEALQLERAECDLAAWRARTPPGEAEIAALDRELSVAKAAYHESRARLFRAWEERREHARAGVDREREVARCERELALTDRALADLAQRQPAMPAGWSPDGRRSTAVCSYHQERQSMQRTCTPGQHLLSDP